MMLIFLVNVVMLFKIISLNIKYTDIVFSCHGLSYLLPLLRIFLCIFLSQKGIIIALFYGSILWEYFITLFYGFK